MNSSSLTFTVSLSESLVNQTSHRIDSQYALFFLSPSYYLISCNCRRWEFPSGPVAGAVEGEERQPLFPSHCGPGHRILPPLGQGSAQGGGHLCSRAGGWAVSHHGGPRGWRYPLARGIHFWVGGVQLQPSQRHPVVWKRADRESCLQCVQTLERLHTPSSHWKWCSQALEDPLS